MHVEKTALDGVLIIRPKVHGDNRGVFFESWERDRYAEAGLPAEWRQDNVVKSHRGVLRGLHFQYPHGQHKLITAYSGEIFDVTVDLRVGSPSFGQWIGVLLSGENRCQLSIPVGFAHGYLVLSDQAIVGYKASTRYDPASERCLRWDDPRVGIDWPAEPTTIAPRDAAGLTLDAFPPEALPGL